MATVYGEGRKVDPAKLFGQIVIATSLRKKTGVALQCTHTEIKGV